MVSAATVITKRSIELKSSVADHLITSSAHSRIESGIVIPRVFAVLRLITSSNLVRSSTPRPACQYFVDILGGAAKHWSPTTRPACTSLRARFKRDRAFQGGNDNDPGGKQTVLEVVARADCRQAQTKLANDETYQVSHKTSIAACLSSPNCAVRTGSDRPRIL